MQAQSSAFEEGLPTFQTLASLWDSPGACRGPGLLVHTGPALHPLTLASLFPQRLGVGWGPLRCRLPDPCQALPPASSTSHSTYARPWMANARRSPRYRLAPHPMSLHCRPHALSLLPTPLHLSHPLTPRLAVPRSLASPRYLQLLLPYPHPDTLRGRAWGTDPSFPPARSCSAAPWLRASSAAPRTSSPRRAPLSSWRSGGSAWKGRSARMSSKAPARVQQAAMGRGWGTAGQL